jgi:hypothetical protein
MEMESTWGSDARGRNKRIQGEATAFRLWQVANLFEWDCTIVECAKAAGINLSTAKLAIRKKGWANRFNCEAVNEARAHGARKGNAKRWQHTHSDAVDVYDMMELG